MSFTPSVKSRAALENTGCIEVDPARSAWNQPKSVFTRWSRHEHCYAPIKPLRMRLHCSDRNPIIFGAPLYARTRNTLLHFRSRVRGRCEPYVLNHPAFHERDQVDFAHTTTTLSQLSNVLTQNMHAKGMPISDLGFWDKSICMQLYRENKDSEGALKAELSWFHFAAGIQSSTTTSTQVFGTQFGQPPY